MHRFRFIVVVAIFAFPIGCHRPRGYEAFDGRRIDYARSLGAARTAKMGLE